MKCQCCPDVDLELKMRDQYGKGLYWCPNCGYIAKTKTIALDPLNEKVYSWSLTQKEICIKMNFSKKNN